MYLLLGACLTVLGAIMLVRSAQIVEVSERYDDACPIDDTNTECQITFTIDEDMDKPVYLYYELRNYFQNHRLYVKSRSAD
jgi:hypothetical protein